MQPAITTYNFDRAAMNAGSGSPFGGMFVLPLTVNQVPTKRSVVGDFILVPFPGDTPQAFVLNDAYVGSDGLVHVVGETIQFEMGIPAVNVTVYGYGCTNTAGTVWTAGQLFDAAVNLVNQFDGVSFQPDIAWGF